MIKKFWPYILFTLIIGLTIGCSSRRQLQSTRERREYNREAMHHIINGAIEELLGQTKNALVEYHQAAEIDTSSAGIYLAMAENYFYLEEYQSSLRMAKKAIQRDPNNVDAWELLAANYEQLRQYTEAARAYERIVKLEPDNLFSLYTLTSLQIITKDYAKALQSYHKLIEAGLTDTEYRLRIGHLFFQNRAFDQAQDVFLNIYKTDPDYEPAYLSLAEVSKAKKDTVAAIQWYKTALQHQPNFEDVKVQLNELLQKKQQWKEAIEIYEKLVSREGASVSDQLQLTQYYVMQGDTLKAIDRIQQIINQHPQSEKGYLALGALQKLQKDTLAAEQTYWTALKQNKLFFEVRRRLRDLYATQKRWDEAIALYEPLKNIDSTVVGAQLEVAQLLMQKGDTLQAIDLCRDLAQKHENEWRIHLSLGRFLMLRRDFLAALKSFDKTLSLRDDFTLIWILRGLCLLQVDNLKEAEDNFLRALNKFPNDAEVAYYLGIVYNRANDVEKAIEFLERANTLEEKNPQTLLALAAAYDEQKQYLRANAIYEVLLQLAPNNATVLNNYAYHLAVRDTLLDKAKEMIQKALQAEPQNPAFLDTEGWIYFRMGLYSQAKEKIEKSIELRADSAEVIEHLGDVYEKLGDLENAVRQWQRALDMDGKRTHLNSKIERYSPNTKQASPQ